MQLIDLCFKKAKCSSVQRQYILICVSWKNIDPRLVNNNVFLDYSVFINHLYLRSIDKLFWTTEFTLKVTFTVVFHKCKELSSCHSYFLVTGYFSVKMTKKKQKNNYSEAGGNETPVLVYKKSSLRFALPFGMEL